MAKRGRKADKSKKYKGTYIATLIFNNKLWIKDHEAVIVNRRKKIEERKKFLQMLYKLQKKK